MFSIERQSLILEQLEQEGKVDVKTLAARFSTSAETIRRDLREMEATGILTRTHGGAVLSGIKRSDGYEYPWTARGVQKYDEKQRICKAAAAMVEDGDTIFLDNSTTTLHLLHYVPRDIKFSVVTNSIQVMLEAGQLKNNNIVVIGLGGVFNAKNYSLTGMFSKTVAQNFFPDKSFMSCRGVDEIGGMTDGSILEVEVKRDMISRSKQFVLLADHSKFGLVGSVFIGGLDEIDCIITDSKTRADQLKIFEGSQTKVVFAE